jgi:hypothetical protein
VEEDVPAEGVPVMDVHLEVPVVQEDHVKLIKLNNNNKYKILNNNNNKIVNNK